MTVADYAQLSVLEKACRQLPLTVEERRVARFLADNARRAKDATLSRIAFG
jgi:hypothetical protein